MPTISVQADSALEHVTKAVAGSDSRIVVILESPRDVGTYLLLKKNLLSAGFLAIGVSPEACWRFDQLREPYEPIDAFCDPDAILRKGLEDFAVVRQICNDIDNALLTRFEFLRKYSVRPAEENFRYIKFLFDALTIKTMYLQGILQREKPLLVLTFEGSNGSVPPSDIPFEKDEHLFDLLLREGVQNCNHVSITGSTGLAIGKTGKTGTFDIKKLLREWCPFLFCSGFLWRHYGIRRLFRLWYYSTRSCCRKKKNICIAGHGGEWLSVYDELVRHQYNVFFLETDWGSSGDDPTLALALPDSADFPDAAKKTGLSGIFYRKLAPVLNRSVCSAKDLEEEIGSFFSKHDIRLCLSGSKSRFFEHLPARIALSRNIPVISWQHGAAGYFEYPLLNYIELLDSSSHVVWGTSVADQIGKDRKDSPVAGCVVRPAGSANLQALHARRPDSPSIDFLYITTNYFYNTQYIGYAHRLQDTTLWRTQQQVLRALGTARKKTIFKLHPGSGDPGHFREFVDAERLDTISVYKREKTTDSLIRESGAIIIDFPSTTLLQALATDKPVFVLLEFSRINDNAKTLLKKRAYCAETLDELLRLLGDYISNTLHQPGVDRGNTDFFEEYGTVANDGKVHDRVMDVLREAAGDS